MSHSSDLSPSGFLCPSKNEEHECHRSQTFDTASLPAEVHIWHHRRRRQGSVAFGIGAALTVRSTSDARRPALPSEHERSDHRRRPRRQQYGYGYGRDGSFQSWDKWLPAAKHGVGPHLLVHHCCGHGLPRGMPTGQPLCVAEAVGVLSPRWRSLWVLTDIIKVAPMRIEFGRISHETEQLVPRTVGHIDGRRP